MRINKIILISAILLFIAFLLTGCWDSKDIHEKELGTAVIIDKKNDEIYFYFEIANIEASNSNEKSGTEKKYTYVTGHGKTIIEARENLDYNLDRPVYLSAVKTLFLTENFVKEDNLIVEYLYRLRGDETYRKKTITVTTKEDPLLLLKTIHENNLSIGIETDDLMTTLDKNGESFARTTLRLLENLSADYTGFLIPCIGLQEENIALKGYSVLNNTKVDNFIPVEESKALIFFKADKAKFRYIVPYKDVNYTIETELKKRDTKPKYENGKITFEVKFDIQASIMYGSKKIPYNLTDDDITKISDALKETFKNELIVTVDQSQNKFMCDYLQFDDTFRIKYPNDFLKMDWTTEYPKADIKIDVNINLKVDDLMKYNSYQLK